MKWDTPSIICCNLCFQSVFVFYFINSWKQNALDTENYIQHSNVKCSWHCLWPQLIMKMKILLYINDKYIMTLQTSLLLKLQAYKTILFSWLPCSSVPYTRNWHAQSTRGADKSLARPGRKQATATKLGIYSTYPTKLNTLLTPLL